MPADGSKKKSPPGGVECAQCHKIAPLEALKKCSRCRRVFYCDTTCQQAHWKHGGHKKVCKPTDGGVRASPTEPPTAAPGDTVKLTGLVKKPELNGTRGTVELRSEWKGDRVAVKVDTRPPQRLWLRPANLIVVTRADAHEEERVCIICRDAGECQAILSGCACRGPLGLAHVACRAEAASHSADITHWSRCTICNVEFTGLMQQGLAEAHWTRVKCNRQHEAWLVAASDYGSSLDAKGMYREAEAVLRDALDESKRRSGVHHESTLLTRTHIALSLSHQGRHTEAEAVYREVLSVQVGPNRDITMTNLANELSEQGKHAEAVELLHAVLERQTHTLGPEHAHTMATATNLANSLSDLGHHDEAAARRHEVMLTQKRVLGDKHPETVHTAYDIATSLFDQKKYIEAEAAYRKVLPNVEFAFGVDHPLTGSVLKSVAVTLTEQGKYAEAEALYKKALTTMRTTLGEEHPETLHAERELIDLLVKVRKHREAKALCQGVLPVVMQVLGDDSPVALYMKHVLAM